MIPGVSLGGLPHPDQNHGQQLHIYTGQCYNNKCVLKAGPDPVTFGHGTVQTVAAGSSFGGRQESCMPRTVNIPFKTSLSLN